MCFCLGVGGGGSWRKKNFAVQVKLKSLRIHADMLGLSSDFLLKA